MTDETPYQVLIEIYKELNEAIIRNTGAFQPVAEVTQNSLIQICEEFIDIDAKELTELSWQHIEKQLNDRARKERKAEKTRRLYENGHKKVYKAQTKRF